MKLVLLALLIAGGLHAQTFDAATVKAVNRRGGRAIREDPGRLSAAGVTLRRLIEHAYSLETYQLSGGPAWLSSEFFDVEGVSERAASPAELREMLRNLLVERFHLAVRRESRETPVYMLVAAKGGLKLRERTASAPQDAVEGRPGRMRFQDVASLASFMSGFADRPVLDGGAVKGDYEIALDVPRPKPVADAGGPPDVGAAMAEFSENLLHMVQEQLGLKAEARKVPMEILMVERAEKPALPTQ